MRKDVLTGIETGKEVDWFNPKYALENPCLQQASIPY